MYNLYVRKKSSYQNSRSFKFSLFKSLDEFHFVKTDFIVTWVTTVPLARKLGLITNIFLIILTQKHIVII